MAHATAQPVDLPHEQRLSVDVAFRESLHHAVELGARLPRSRNAVDVFSDDAPALEFGEFPEIAKLVLGVLRAVALTDSGVEHNLPNVHKSMIVQNGRFATES